MLALERDHLDILEYLLDRFYDSWPKKTLINFLELWNEGYSNWINAIPIIMKSKLAHAYYLSLDHSEKKEIVYGLIQGIQTEKFEGLEMERTESLAN